MRKVLKSYLKSFIKAWVETFGTIIFVLTLTAVVVGMVATPLQLTSKNRGIENETNHWDNYVTPKTSYFNDNFLFSYFYEGKSYNRPNGDSIIANPLGEGKILFSTAVMNYLKPIVDQEKEGNHGELGKEIRNIFATYQKGGAALFNEISGQEIFSAEFQEILSENYYNDINYFIVENVLTNQNEKIDISYELSFFLTKQDVGNNSFELDLRQADNTKEQLINGTPINQLIISKGRTIETNSMSEIVLTEKYAKTNNIKIGDKISLPGINSTTLPKELTVVGFGTKFDTLTPSSNYSMLTSDPDNYSYGFVSYEFLDQLRSETWKSDRNNTLKFDTIIRTKNIIPGLNVINLFAVDLMNSNSIYREGENFITAQYDYPTINALSNIRIQVIIFLVLAVVVLVLAFIFINFVIKKEINNTRVQLGIFKAFGYKNSELSWIFATKMLITIFIGVFAGYLISIPLQNYVSGQFSGSVTYAFSSVYFSLWFATIIFVVIPLLFTLISYLLTLSYLNESALKLITNASKPPTKSTFKTVMKWVFFPVGITSLVLTKTAQSLSYHNRGFTWRLQQSFTARGKGKFVMVILIFSFSALLFTLQLGAKAVMGSAISQGYEMVQDGVDHRFSWKKLPEIDYKDGKVSIINSDWRERNSQNIGYTGDIQTSLKSHSSNFRENFAHVLDLLIEDSISNPAWIFNLQKVYSKTDLTNPELINLQNLNNLDDFATTDASKTAMGATFQNAEQEYNNYYLKDISRTLCLMTEAAPIVNSRIPQKASGNCNDLSILEANSAMNSDDNTKVDFFQGVSPDVRAMLSMALTAEPDANAVVTPNQIYIDSQKELLQYKTDVLVNDLNSQKFDLELDYFDDNLGRTQNIYKFSGVSDSQFNELKTANSDPTVINSIVSYRIAKLLNLSVGSEFKVRTNTTTKQELTIRVSGINRSNAFGTLIIASYENYFNAFKTSDENDNEVINDLKTNKIVYGNSIWSKQPLFNGAIDIDNIGQSIANLKFAKNNVAISVGKDTPIFGTIFQEILNGIGEQTFASGPERFDVLTNGSLLASTELSSSIPLNLMTATLDTILARSTVLMTIFILLVAFLLTIILVVIMNIVVDEAAVIILTMRALGYKPGEINWVVMGNYLIWTLIGFLIAYVLSVIVWTGILEFVWQSFGILIPFPSDWQTPVISFSILAAIMVVGWITAMLKISNRPLTNITAYS
ncbi:ABC transporter permease [Spiroplasma sabaudiense Ar-1343]|uniref:ABC transporter permease n=1 Tax=Spiroplasma sabaudiense Ar-1343 TaxID=1276257 RepID=W6AAD1_9MOLU|nr:ABC transporter permease [Spiroplasma sabaudiense]AHI54017.1 ABC transporter permease [Spiroplasma sabaudiense Ar-1343]